ncbi:MAG: prephenate dehydratase [Deltaproteobacteria bacterium]|nr:prephenate dehydratase [Deltaproteobacteria bacterium]MBW2444650.1 prephenate dehydratase [Deltaproteobacteria bacterium]
MSQQGQRNATLDPVSEGPELERLRAAIDAVDRQILEKLNERARLVEDVGRHKQSEAAPVYAAARERDIVERLRSSNDGPFPDAGLPHVFREIISATRSLERVVRVAFLGPEGSFAHLAARQQFGSLAELVPVPSIPDVYSAVERGKTDLGVVPIENTTEGVVTQSLDRCVESEVTICAEILLRISQCLMSRSGRLEDVRRVASHPQGLAQTREWLARHLPGIEQVETQSTARAAEWAASEPDVAAVTSEMAAEIFGLKIIERAIEDRRDNTTRFLVIGERPPAPSGQDLTSVVFTLRKAESGALHRLLDPFSRHGVNLASIQSRPLKGRPWEYLFFVDLEGHVAEERVQAALAEAADRVNSYKVLGSFPRTAVKVEEGAAG